MRICSFEGCERPLKVKGLCITHYNMWNKGTPLHPIGKQGGSGKGASKKYDGCIIPQCTAIHRAKGYCSNHYNQIKKYGAIVVPKSKIKSPSKPKAIRPEYWGRKICGYETCESKVHTKGYCHKHYQRVILAIPYKQRGGHNKKPKVKCEVDNCDSMGRVKGLCDKHYSRMRKHGDTGVNHHRKYRSQTIHLDNVLRPHMQYFSTVDEREVINEMFGESDRDNCKDVYY